MGETRLGPETPFEKRLSQPGVQENFQIECRTQGSRIIFKLNVTCGGQRVFLVDCHTRESRRIFKFNVAGGAQEVFSN